MSSFTRGPPSPRECGGEPPPSARLRLATPPIDRRLTDIPMAGSSTRSVIGLTMASIRCLASAMADESPRIVKLTHPSLERSTWSRTPEVRITDASCRDPSRSFASWGASGKMYSSSSAAAVAAGGCGGGLAPPTYAPAIVPPLAPTPTAAWIIATTSGSDSGHVTTICTIEASRSSCRPRPLT